MLALTPIIADTLNKVLALAASAKLALSANNKIISILIIKLKYLKLNFISIIMSWD